MLTRAETAAIAFEEIKDDLKSKGHSLTNFPKNYPISRRSAYNIRDGVFTLDLLRKIPGFKVVEWFEVV